MKKILLVLFVLLILALGALVFLVLSLNPNAYRPELEQYLLKTYGVQAQIGHISIHWGLDFGLEVDGVELKDPKTNNLLMKSHELTAGLDLRDLIARQISIKSVTINQPEINLLRNPSGDWNWEIITLPQQKAPSSALPASVAPEGPTPAGEAEIAPSYWSFLISNVRINGGTVHYRDESLKKPFSLDVYEINVHVRQPYSKAPIDLSADALLRHRGRDYRLFVQGNYELTRDRLAFEFHDAQKILQADAVIESLTKNIYFKGKADIQQLDLDSITPDAWRDQEYIVGFLSAHVEGEGSAASLDILKTSLLLNGTAQILQGAFKNINFVGDTLRKITVVQGLSGMLVSKMPPNLAPIFQGKDTPFDRLESKFHIENSKMSVKDAYLAHPEYQIQAQGSLGLVTQQVNFNIRLILLKSLTDYVIGRVNEMANLRSPDGTMTIPVVVSGVLPKASVQPDLTYLAGQLLQQQAQEFLAKGLEKLLKGN